MVERKNEHLAGWAAVVIIVALVLILSIILSQKKEVHISNGGQVLQVYSLECSSSGAEDTFFRPNEAQRYTETIRATFREDRLEDISYEFLGTYQTDAAVEQDIANLHARYNIYMGEQKVNPESLSPVFSPMNTKLKITLFGDKDKLNTATARMFFLTSDEVDKPKTLSLKKIRKIYEAKGFACQSSE